LTAASRQRLQQRLGQEIVSCQPLSGGDISQAYQVVLKDRSELFVKLKAQAPPGFFEAEARGLEWLRQTRVLRIPEVVAVAPDFLVLEYLQSASKSSDFEEGVGRVRAQLHRCSWPTFGLDHDNYIGLLAQSNQPCDSWPQFFVQHRLHPLLELALRQGKAPAHWARRFERLYRGLPQILTEEPPARLHGDLWAGNLLVGPQGQPCLIDPAVYAGHREVDLAMMRLFGGFGPRVFQAYQEDFPLAAGAAERVPLFQLYPLLVHVNLFGGSYLASVESALQKLP